MGGFISRAKAVETQQELDEQARNGRQKQIQSPIIDGKQNKSTVTGQILSPSRPVVPPSDLVFPFNGFRQKLPTSWSIDKN